MTKSLPVSLDGANITLGKINNGGSCPNILENVSATNSTFSFTDFVSAKSLVFRNLASSSARSIDINETAVITDSSYSLDHFKGGSLNIAFSSLTGKYLLNLGENNLSVSNSDITLSRNISRNSSYSFIESDITWFPIDGGEYSQQECYYTSDIYDVGQCDEIIQ